jgi:hypothetical protein
MNGFINKNGIDDIGNWKISTFCQSGGCVQVNFTATSVMVRDSKETNSPVLVFTNAEWVAFIDGAKVGEFDLV